MRQNKVDIEKLAISNKEFWYSFFETSDCNDIAKCVVKQLIEEEV